MKLGGGERERSSVKQGSHSQDLFDHFIVITETFFLTRALLLGTFIPLISSKYI